MARLNNQPILDEDPPSTSLTRLLDFARKKSYVTNDDILRFFPEAEQDGARMVAQEGPGRDRHARSADGQVLALDETAVDVDRARAGSQPLRPVEREVQRLLAQKRAGDCRQQNGKR